MTVVYTEVQLVTSQHQMSVWLTLNGSQHQIQLPSHLQPQLDIYSLLPSHTTQAAHDSNTTERTYLQTELNDEFKNAAISLKKSAAFSTYISCAKLQLDLFIADYKYDSTSSPITRPYQIPWLFQQGWMAKIHQYTIQRYCRHLQVLGQLSSVFLWI